jgi:hypothetical protein
MSSYIINKWRFFDWFWNLWYYACIYYFISKFLTFIPSICWNLIVYWWWLWSIFAIISYFTIFIFIILSTLFLHRFTFFACSYLWIRINKFLLTLKINLLIFISLLWILWVISNTFQFLLCIQKWRWNFIFLLF